MAGDEGEGSSFRHLGAEPSTDPIPAHQYIAGESSFRGPYGVRAPFVDADISADSGFVGEKKPLVF